MVRVRDALAGLPEAALPEVADRWGRTEELSYEGELPPGLLLPLLRDLVGLAGRARSAGEGLYCWVCV